MNRTYVIRRQGPYDPDPGTIKVMVACEEPGVSKWYRLPHVRHHSSDFEIGSAGPGASDLALSILADQFPLNTQMTSSWSGAPVSARAWRLHYSFARTILAEITLQSKQEYRLGQSTINGFLLDRGVTKTIPD